MAKQNRNEKPKNVWYRLITFAEENQKVIWVLLLLILAPTFAMTGLYTQAFAPKEDTKIFTRVFGQNITQGEIRRAQEGLQQVQARVRSIAMSTMEPLAGSLGSAMGQTLYEEMDPIDYFVFKKKAIDLGLRVSDAELRETIRDLWQRYEAAVRAQKELDTRPGSKAKGPNDYSQFFERLELTKKKLTELRGGDGKYFDPNSWGRYIEGSDPSNRQGSVREFEDMLRDFILIAKLEAFVTSGVQVTPQEVFSEYNKEAQSRKFTWVELKVSDAVLEKVSKSLKPADVKSYYETQKHLFQKSASIRTAWLLLPKEHFKAEAEKSVNEDGLKAYYVENRNQYRKPTVLSAEVDFAVRSVEEKTKYDSELYMPFEEVKDKVREKVIEEKTRTDLRAFADKIQQRMFPPRTGDAAKTQPDKPVVSFEELAKEFAFLKTGTSGFVERAKAKEAFGDAFSPFVDSWFSTLEQTKPLNLPRSAQSTDHGQVFYLKPESRPNQYLPAFAEIQAEVGLALAKQKVLEEVETVLKKVAEEQKDLTAVASGIDITVDGELIHVDAAPAQSSTGFVAKTGRLMVPKKEAEKRPDDAKMPDSNDEDLQEEAHPSSTEIVQAAFGLPAADKGQVVAATDLEASAAFLVRFDDLKLPDPAKFEARRDSLEQQLRAEQASTAFAEWKRKLLEKSKA